jgi:hypothetical protein
MTSTHQHSSPIHEEEKNTKRRASLTSYDVDSQLRSKSFSSSVFTAAAGNAEA